MLFLLLWLCFFFCKQKTAYEMRISDLSSDVCSSDLLIAKAGAVGRLVRLVQHLDDPGGEVEHAGVQRLPDAEAGIEAAGEGGDEGLLATVPALLFPGV